MEKGNLSKWLKKEGDAVKSGDLIAEIETDKATMEVEAVDEGTLGKILVPEGTADVAVNTPIAMILADGEDPASLKDGGAPGRQQKAATRRLQLALNKHRRRPIGPHHRPNQCQQPCQHSLQHHQNLTFRKAPRW